MLVIVTVYPLHIQSEKLTCFVAEDDEEKQRKFIKLAISWIYADRSEAIPKRLEVCISCFFLWKELDH